jgi:hypothetical protein
MSKNLWSSSKKTEFLLKLKWYIYVTRHIILNVYISKNLKNLLVKEYAIMELASK